MCVLDRQGIPEFLLHGEDDSLDFEDHLAPLIEFSLITAEVEDQRWSFKVLTPICVRRLRDPLDRRGGH
jgi:hypothetical protein